MPIRKMLQEIEKEEIRINKKEENIAAEVVFEYLKKCEARCIRHKINENNINKMYEDYYYKREKKYFIGNLLLDCFKLKNTLQGDLLEEIMVSHGFNYANSIHNAIYYLLGDEYELLGNKYDLIKNEYELRTIGALNWPGVYEIKKDGIFYDLDTKHGKIRVANAALKFEDTKFKLIFDQDLIHRCYERTYDFVEQDPDSYAVMVRQPNFFHGDHYHAYIEKGDSVIDIAANAYYESKEEAAKVIKGELIARLSFAEIEEECRKISPEIGRDEKIYVLTAYNDAKQRMSRK